MRFSISLHVKMSQGYKIRQAVKHAEKHAKNVISFMECKNFQSELFHTWLNQIFHLQRLPWNRKFLSTVEAPA